MRGPAAAMIAVLSVIFLITPGSAAAKAEEGATSTPQALFAAANSHYAAGRFDAARTAYQGIADAGVQSASLFYNLGNACAQTGDIGRAVRYLELARRIAPRDPDISENLRRVAPAGYAREPGVLAKPFVSIRDLVSQDEWILALGATLLLFGAAGAIHFARGGGRGLQRRLFALTSIAVAAVVPFAVSSLWVNHVAQTSVVKKGPAAVLAGPGDAFTVLQNLEAGIMIRVMGQSDDAWLQVELNNGRIGFVRSDHLESVRP